MLFILFFGCIFILGGCLWLWAAASAAAGFCVGATNAGGTVFLCFINIEANAAEYQCENNNDDSVFHSYTDFSLEGLPPFRLFFLPFRQALFSLLYYF